MRATPRVGVNLLWLVPGVVGGSEEYTVRLLTALAERLGSRLDVVVYGNRLLPAAHPGLVERYRTVIGPVSGHDKPLRVATETTWLAAAARRHGVGLVHHMGGILPLVQPVPSVLTIHDLQPLAMPEHFHPVKRAFHRAVLPWSARSAERIVTLTEFTRHDLRRRLGVDGAKVEVVPSGIEADPPPPTAEVVERVLSRYGLSGRPYFLYPAITYPHKNHGLLVDAMAVLHRQRPDARLVLTGGQARCEEVLAEQVRALGIGEVVVRTGRIPAGDLDALYHAATGLTFPSLFEGFGLPVLEAMARGCPVLAARATALPEVVGDAGLLLDPRDAKEWARAMQALIDDPDRGAALATAGRRRAAAYRWDDAAATLERVWREVLG